ncbi:uncharacterized protein LOC123529497 isoform X2 [Mercenaria mercenaria]|uniref:uncharacterized protein LOC123529497 isoform X2 n=1 Tax=Mercenaria mercenaria TaxID=6596 RepID=UPI00234E9344|nr:uncharacterized protein LOC123529497 isoform X2 [Mercenaria mercenaria]
MDISDNLTLEKAIEALEKVKAEFEIDNGRIAIITSDRYAETYDIMGNHFTPDEPLSKAFGVTWNEEFEQSVHKTLVQNVSICMISRDTNEVMGVRVIGLMRKSDPPSDFSSIKYEQLRSLYEFLNHKQYEVNFFERYEVDEAIHFTTLGVHKKFRRMGLGGRLLGAAVAMCRELGFKAIQGEGTSNFSQRIYEKQGFETLITMPYDSYFYKGQPIINATGEHTMTKIYGLKL